MRWDYTDYIMNAFMTLVLVFICVVMVYAVAALKVDKQCLEAGYPKSQVAYDFEGYCMNLEGTVTVKVEKLE